MVSLLLGPQSALQFDVLVQLQIFDHCQQTLSLGQQRAENDHTNKKPCLHVLEDWTAAAPAAAAATVVAAPAPAAVAAATARDAQA